MSYDSALQDYREARKRFRRAEQEMAAEQIGLAAHRKVVPELHEELTTAIAKFDVGDVNEKEVDECRTKYDQALKELEDRKIRVAAKQKAVPMFREKMDVARQAYMKLAYPYFQGKAVPVIEGFVEAFAALERADSTYRELWNEMKKNGVDGTQHMPPPAEAFTISLEGLRKPYTPQMWLENAAEMNENFKLKGDKDGK